jgi:L-cystine transport system permease protein
MSFNLDFFIKTFFTAFRGMPVTLKLTAFSLLLSLPVGFIFAVLRLKEKSTVKKMITVYVSFIRGTPIVVQILVIYSVVPSILAAVFGLLKIRINIFDVNPMAYAYIVFTMNTIALLSEVFRSALTTVDRGQLEAAHAIGLTTFQGYRRIVIPQAMVAALPNICTTTTNLIKSTSLAFLMTVKDITAVAKVEAAYGYNYIEAYLVIWIIYIIICSIVELLFKLLEKRLKVYKKALVS